MLIIIGVLLAIAVPAYLGFKERAEKRASASNARTATRASFPALKGIDAGIKLTNAKAETNSTANDGYCLSSQVGSWWAGVHGPGGTITNARTDPCA